MLWPCTSLAVQPLRTHSNGVSPSVQLLRNTSLRLPEPSTHGPSRPDDRLVCAATGSTMDDSVWPR